MRPAVPVGFSQCVARADRVFEPVLHDLGNDLRDQLHEKQRHREQQHLQFDRHRLSPVLPACRCAPTIADYRSSTSRSGSSRLSFTRTRKVTASLPSTMRWS